jgi:NADP-dependent 3-hydroxy acid dehydrogenase YdfG
LEDIAQSLGQTTEVRTLCFDIREEDSAKNAIAQLSPEWQKIDVLINNAGLALGKAYLDTGLSSDWDQMLDTNVKGLLYTTRAILPLLKSSNNAHIINIGSIAGTEVYPGGNVYCASKHAVNALTKSMRMELLQFAIRVSQIRPGLADTEFSVVRYKGNKEKAKQVYQGFEALQAEDIARAVNFVLESPKHVCINDLEITPTAQANAYLIDKDL